MAALKKSRSTRRSGERASINPRTKRLRFSAHPRVPLCQQLLWIRQRDATVQAKFIPARYRYEFRASRGKALGELL
jgi:hypothetical protein